MPGVWNPIEQYLGVRDKVSVRHGMEAGRGLFCWPDADADADADADVNLKLPAWWRTQRAFQTFVSVVGVKGH